ncbi:MAG: class I SAM-dependent methyltransferase [Bacteroidia bacterium]
MKKDWFLNWFGTRYYKILYQHRDTAEAKIFLDKLLDHLHPAPKARILDVACGKGRHAAYLASKGYEVTGIDIVEENIKEAKRGEKENLRFHIHDMREPFGDHEFDIQINLFTSFGYFESQDENRQVISNIYDTLAPGGYVVIDFLNCNKVIANLRREEDFSRDGIQFHIRRFTEKGFIVKEIRINDNGEEHLFFERVECLNIDDFRDFLKDFSITDVFGSYDLALFDPASSDRLIIIAQKPDHV